MPSSSSDSSEDSDGSVTDQATVKQALVKSEDKTNKDSVPRRSASSELKSRVRSEIVSEDIHERMAKLAAENAAFKRDIDDLKVLVRSYRETFAESAAAAQQKFGALEKNGEEQNKKLEEVEEEFSAAKAEQATALATEIKKVKALQQADLNFLRTMFENEIGTLRSEAEFLYNDAAEKGPQFQSLSKAVNFLLENDGAQGKRVAALESTCKVVATNMTAELRKIKVFPETAGETRYPKRRRGGLGGKRCYEDFNDDA